MSRKFKFILIALICFNSPFAFADWDTSSKVSLYSGTSYLTRTNDVVTENVVRSDFLRHDQDFSTYIRALLDQDSETTPELIYNDNNASLAAGLTYHVPVVPISFFAEYRQVFSLVQRAVPLSPGDARGGAYAYDFFEMTSAERSTFLFNEDYADASYSSRLLSSEFGGVWSKTGLRYKIGSKASLDTYVEGVLARTSSELVADNLQEVGPGIRFSSQLGTLSGSVSIRRGFGAKTLDQNSSSYVHWASTVTLTGEF